MPAPFGIFAGTRGPGPGQRDPHLSSLGFWSPCTPSTRTECTALDWLRSGRSNDTRLSSPHASPATPKVPRTPPTPHYSRTTGPVRHAVAGRPAKAAAIDALLSRHRDGRTLRQLATEFGSTARSSRTCCVTPVSRRTGTSCPKPRSAGSSACTRWVVVQPISKRIGRAKSTVREVLVRTGYGCGTRMGGSGEMPGPSFGTGRGVGTWRRGRNCGEGWMS